MSESEQREIKEAAISWAAGHYSNHSDPVDLQAECYIAGATAMAEKKNLEVKVWKNTADKFKKYNDGLKAQLELEKLKEWREINMQEVANTVLGNEIFQQQLKAKEAELSRVKEVAEKMGACLEKYPFNENKPLSEMESKVQEALTEMRIEIKTNGPVKDQDIRAIYLLREALKMSTPRMRQANLKFAVESFYAKSKD